MRRLPAETDCTPTCGAGSLGDSFPDGHNRFAEGLSAINPDPVTSLVLSDRSVVRLRNLLRHKIL